MTNLKYIIFLTCMTFHPLISNADFSSDCKSLNGHTCKGGNTVVGKYSDCHAINHLCHCKCQGTPGADSGGSPNVTLTTADVSTALTEIKDAKNTSTTYSRNCEALSGLSIVECDGVIAGNDDPDVNSKVENCHYEGASGTYPGGICRCSVNPLGDVFGKKCYNDSVIIDADQAEELASEKRTNNSLNADEKKDAKEERDQAARNKKEEQDQAARNKKEEQDQAARNKKEEQDQAARNKKTNQEIGNFFKTGK